MANPPAKPAFRLDLQSLDDVYKARREATKEVPHEAAAATTRVRAALEAWRDTAERLQLHKLATDLGAKPAPLDLDALRSRVIDMANELPPEDALWAAIQLRGAKE